MSSIPNEEGEQEVPQVNPLETKLATYKQKLKILKKAYIEEQTEKEAFKKQILSLCNTNEKLQKDLEEMEQKYLKWYRSNQELHDQIIQEKSNATPSRGSLYWGSSAPSDASATKSPENGSSHTNNSEVQTLKINQLEKQIKHLEGKVDSKEMEVEEKQNEVRETEQRLKEIEKELSQYKHEFESEKEKLQEQFTQKETELEYKITEIMNEKTEFKNSQEKMAQEKIKEVVDRETAERETLKEKIEVGRWSIRSYNKYVLIICHNWLFKISEFGEKFKNLASILTLSTFGIQKLRSI